MTRRRLLTLIPVLSLLAAGAAVSFLYFPDVLFALTNRADPAAGLASENPHLRRAAARTIAEQGEARADTIPTLEGLLADEKDGETRWLAAYALTRMGPAAEPALDRLAFGTRNDPAARLAASRRPFPTAAAELVKLLEHPNASIREEARARLRPGQPAAADAAPLLVEACRKQTQPEPPVKQTPMVGPPAPSDFPAGAPFTVVPPDRSFEPDTLLAEMRIEALPAVCRALRESAADDSRAAGRFRLLLATVLEAIGPPAVDAVPLLTAMAATDTDRGARVAAGRARRRVDPATIPDLVRELEAAGVSNEAWTPLDDLAAHGREAAASVPAVSRVLREAKDSWIRLVAARTLAAVGDPDQTIAVLTATLATPHAGAAAEVLGKLGPRAASAAPALEAAARRTDLSPLDRSNLFRAFCQVRPPDPEWLASQLDPGGLSDEGNGPAEALVELGPAAVPATAKALATGSAATKTRAATVLGRIRPVNAEAVAALAAALADPEPDRRAEAAWALGMLGPDAAAAGPALLRAADEADSPDRAATFRDTARLLAPDAVAASSDPTRTWQLAGVWAAVLVLAAGWLVYRRRAHPAPRAAR